MVRDFFSIPLTDDTNRDDDRLLIKAALSGDDGFEKLVRTYEQMVYRVAFRFLNNETDALDVSQEVFIKVHNSLSQFRGDSALSTWIHAITANLSRNAIRSRKNREKVQVLAPKERDENDRTFWERMSDKKDAGATRKTEGKDLNEAIQQALEELPIDFREAVILRDLEALDYEAIAKSLKLGLGTVKSRIARGRALLREKLKDWL
jgi:RNA polymerase sigma-70 factor (ECF subfamily)